MNQPAESAWSANIDGLMRSVKAGRIVHAVLFTGPRGTGKRTAARQVAQALLCSGEDKPCGVCPECKQFLAGSHPDMHTLATEERSISVETIRELREELALRPFEGGRHVVIIEQAEKMTTQAQNALLKTLEEPIGEVVFLLITDQPGGMLTTIISRCQRIRFAPIGMDECADALARRGIEPVRARMLAGFSQGSVGRALEIDKSEGYFELRDNVVSALKALDEGRSAVAKAAAMLEDKKDSNSAMLEIMEVTARDLMAVQNGCQPYTDVKDIKLDGRGLLLAVMEMRRMLSGNVSWMSALEWACLEIVK